MIIYHRGERSSIFGCSDLELFCLHYQLQQLHCSAEYFEWLCVAGKKSLGFPKVRLSREQCSWWTMAKGCRQCHCQYWNCTQTVFLTVNRANLNWTLFQWTALSGCVQGSIKVVKVIKMFKDMSKSLYHYGFHIGWCYKILCCICFMYFVFHWIAH